MFKFNLSFIQFVACEVSEDGECDYDWVNEEAGGSSLGDWKFQIRFEKKLQKFIIIIIFHLNFLNVFVQPYHQLTESSFYSRLFKTLKINMFLNKCRFSSIVLSSYPL